MTSGRPISVAFIADTRELNKGLAKTQAALNDTGAEATQAADKVEKVFLRVTDRADGAATKFSILGGAVGDVSGGIEKFGSKLGLSAGTIEKITGGSEALSTALMFGAGVSDIAAVSGELLNGVNLKSAALKVKDTVATTAKAAAEKAAAVASKAMAAAQWLLNAALTANPIGLLIAGLVALGAGLVLAYKKSETFRNIVNGAFQAIMSVVQPVIDWFKTFIPEAFEVVKGIFTTYFNAYKAVVSAVFTAIKTVISTYIEVWKTVISTALNAIKAVFTTIWNAVKTVTSSAFQGLKSLVTGPLDSIVDFIKGVPGKITALGGKFKDAGSALMHKIVDGIKGAAGFIGDIASGIWNAVKSMVNQGIDKINAALEFSIKIGPKTFTVNPPNIPHLANGGITTGPTLALIGDNPGGREAVIPLDKYDLSGGRTYNITVNAPVGSSSADIGREIAKHIAAYERAGGRKRAA